MKLSSYLLSFGLALFLSFAQGKDLFPVKSLPSYSKFWNVKYFSTYKIVSNLASKTSYLLYQRGTTPPSPSKVGRHDAVLKIPLTGNNIGLTQSTSIPYVELLGVQTRVKAYFGNTDYVASKCFLQLVSSKSITNFVGNTSSVSALAKAGINASTIVTFAGAYDEIGAIAHKVITSEYMEKTNEGIYEWLKFYALFFNLEATANRLCSATFTRARCLAKNAASITATTKNHPVVLWAFYASYAKGWSIGRCPNYYCDFAKKCASSLLPAKNGSITAYGANFLTDAEFVKFGKTAMYWIYPSNDWSKVYRSKSSVLKQFKSVQSKKVYDNQGSGEDAWFEERYIEFDVVTEDFCSLVGNLVPPTTGSRKRLWLRNVFTEPVGSLGSCTNRTAPRVSRATPCVPKKS